MRPAGHNPTRAPGGPHARLWHETAPDSPERRLRLSLRGPGTRSTDPLLLIADSSPTAHSSLLLHMRVHLTNRRCHAHRSSDRRRLGLPKANKRPPSVGRIAARRTRLQGQSTGRWAAHRRGLAESLRPPDDAHWLCHTDQTHFRPPSVRPSAVCSWQRGRPRHRRPVHGSAEGRGIDGSPARDSGGTDTRGRSAHSVMAVSVRACVSGGWELGLVTRPHSGRISGGGEPAIGDAV